MDEDVAEGIGGKLDFLEHFSVLPDPRQSKKVLYPLDEVCLTSAPLGHFEGFSERRISGSS